MSTNQTETIVRRPKRRPNGSGKHTNRSFRIADPLWFAGIKAAHKRGFTLASYLVDKVQELVDDVETNG